MFFVPIAEITAEMPGSALPVEPNCSRQLPQLSRAVNGRLECPARIVVPPS